MIRVELGFNDGATPKLEALAAALARPQSLLLPVAREGATLLKRYYHGLNDRKPNRLKGTRTNWWHGVASSVNKPVIRDRTSATIAITEPGLGLHVSGGTVRPRERKSLAIPIHADSHGVGARDWDKRNPSRRLFKFRSKKGNDLLGVRHGDGVLPMYVLRKSAEIPADPDALPSAKDFETPLVQYARQRLATLIRRTQTT